MAEPLIILEPQNFKRLVLYIVAQIARDVICGRRGYFEAEDLVCFCIRDWPGRDYNYSLELLAKLIDRYSIEQLRLASSIRERATRMITLKIKPSTIKSTVMSLDKDRILGESTITEILRAEWVASRA